ncbi:1-acylglycerol-3-phosphate O-acyltransferase [Marinobacter sp. CHS3-4]|uniref:lysophospholipid acyltransferase family protein n=1 Tax=Marinobacter sp. CHS3-4 TaxID=3045174 RepID=UPI0024B5638A|nr:1-acylglycerol-3-phosphate O-acyltransferase [Marinobacter sp. CHS3-4]MDI9244011.1 1-acylglycerol-3-phosphate O-acyltransferase [Marinobacter sp. CHS3-4]
MGLLRKVLAWLSVPVICLFALLFYLARPFNPDNNRYLAWVIARVGRALLGIQCTVSGKDNIPTDRPTVVIANHQHNDDLFILGDLLPRRTVTVGKSSLVWVPFFGQVFWLGGNVIINRGRSTKAVAVMRATANAIREERKSLWVFPEGTRSRGRGLQSFKKGAFHSAVAAGAPITMICVSPYHDKTSGWSGRRESVSIRVLPPVETDGLTSDDIPNLMRDCHEAMQKTIETLPTSS